jgi:hypothetical protein
LAAGFLAGAFTAAGLAAALRGADFLASTTGVVTGSATTGADSKTGATCTGASTLYGAASGCTAGAKALGLGDLNQSKTAFNIKFSYEVFTIATKNWFKN